MTHTQTIQFAQWILRQEKNLQALYKDVLTAKRDHPSTTFLEYAEQTFKNTNLFESIKNPHSTPENLIQIRVVCASGVVQNVFSNVSGKCFDVDVIDIDIQDPDLADKAKANATELEDTHLKIF